MRRLGGRHVERRCLRDRAQWALEARRMVEERKAAEYATLIQVSYPRRLPSAVRHRPRVRTQARIAVLEPAFGGRGLVDLNARHGEDANEVIKAQDRHLREAVTSGAPDHEPALTAMKGRWKRPISGMRWYRQAQRDFAALPDEPEGE